jgi:hypothetical protein
MMTDRSGAARRWFTPGVFLRMLSRPMDERRWIFDHIDTEAFELLARGLSGAELQSVLLGVMQQRARLRAPKDVLAQYQRDAFCAPATVDLRVSVALDAHLLAAAGGFEAIELSPVTPLGTCSAVAPTDQNRVLSALRGTEVVSDPTNVLALECALRLRAVPSAPVHLTTSHRVLRAQPMPKRPGHTQHFRLFALASAGPESKDHSFSIDTLVFHVRTMLGALDRLEQHGYAFGARRVDVLATSQRERVGARVVEALGGLASLKSLEHAYYSGGLRYQIWVTTPEGLAQPIIDGGTFDWLGKIGSNRRAVYVATGAGTQLMALAFRVPKPPP